MNITLHLLLSHLQWETNDSRIVWCFSQVIIIVQIGLSARFIFESDVSHDGCLDGLFSYFHDSHGKDKRVTVRRSNVSWLKFSLIFLKHEAILHAI